MRRSLMPYLFHGQLAPLVLLTGWLCGCYVVDRPFALQLARSPMSYDRETAAYSLKRIDDAEVVDALRRLSRDPEASVRAEATESLGYSRDPNSLPDLCERLFDRGTRLHSEWMGLAWGTRLQAVWQIADESLARRTATGLWCAPAAKSQDEALTRWRQ